MFERSKQPRTDRHFRDDLRYIADFLCDNQIDFIIHTVAKQLSPRFGAFHDGRSCSFIDIKSGELPILTYGKHSVISAFDNIEIILMLRSVEIPDVNGNTQMTIGVGSFTL